MVERESKRRGKKKQQRKSHIHFLSLLIFQLFFPAVTRCLWEPSLKMSLAALIFCEVSARGCSGCSEVLQGNKFRCPNFKIKRACSDQALSFLIQYEPWGSLELILNRRLTSMIKLEHLCSNTPLKFFRVREFATKLWQKWLISVTG